MRSSRARWTAVLAAVCVCLTVATPAPARDWTAPGAVEPWIEIATEEIAAARLNPPRASRLLAHVSVAARDSEVASRLIGRGAGHPAIAAAESAMLSELLPGRAAVFRAFEAQAITAAVGAGLVEASRAERAAAVGRLAAALVIARSRTDGAHATWSGTPPTGTGLWVPTPPAYAPALEPLAGSWRTWNLERGNELRPPPPPGPPSAEYADQVRTVHEVSRHLTDAQRRIAEYWSDGAGTVTPPGHWNRIALDIVRGSPLSPGRAARLFAALNTAQADAFIACWDAKYRYWSERPVTAIRREIDSTWLPLLPTPPFPSYPSGHATTSAAAATVLGAYFPPRAVALASLADEAALSRVYAGIHFPVDSEAGLELGREVAQRTLSRWLYRPP